MTNRFPAFHDLEGRRALLLGEGEAAERRAEVLLNCGAVLVRAVRFHAALLDDCAIAIGAAQSGERAADHPVQQGLRAMSQAARARGIPCNVVDQPELSSFITPAVVLRPPLAIAISSGGAAPVLARLLRARIEALVPPGFGRLASLAGRLQLLTRARLPDMLQRRRLLEAAFSGPVAELVLEGREAEAEAAYLKALEAAAAGSRAPPRAMVHLIEPGPGDADLVTLRALRLLGEADVIVHGPEESAAVLDLARRDALRRMVSDDEAPALLCTLAATGGKIARLSPTPADAAALREAGIDHTLVPGVSRSRSVSSPGLTGGGIGC